MNEFKIMFMKLNIKMFC